MNSAAAAGSAIASRASRAGRVVMGGYGHPRAYELVLGGVTRTMLASMTVPVPVPVPVLMSH